MKRTIIALTLSAFAVTANAAETVGGKLGCLTGQYLEDLYSFKAAGDMDSFQAYLDAKKCFTLKDGIKVTVKDAPGLLGGHWKVIIHGISVHVQREGIRDF